MKKKNHEHFLVGAILITVVVIVALDVLCIIFACFAPAINFWLTGNQTEYDHMHLEDALFSTCLSIIAMAISVWAVLNILNALDKNYLDNLQCDLENIKLNHIQSLKEISDIQLECSKNELLSELIKNLSDRAIEFIYKTIRDMPVTSLIPFYELTRIVQAFLQVYNLHVYEHDDMLLKRMADQGIEESSDLLNKIRKEQNNDVQTIEFILEYFLGEFYYYKAYCYTDPRRVELALLAIGHFRNSIELFGIEIPEYYEYVGKYPSQFISCQDGKERIASYICNTIGDAYSIIIKKRDEGCKTTLSSDDTERYRKMAVFYCAYAVEWSNWSEEIYLRNYGCALERVCSIEINDDETKSHIFDIYQKALDISIESGVIPYKVFYTWLSLYHKQTDIVVEKAICDKRDMDFQNDFQAQYLSKHAENAVLYAELAMQIFRGKIVFQKFYTLALRSLCVLELVRNNIEKAAEYYFKMKSSAYALNVYYRDSEKHDTFMKKINAAVNELEKNFSVECTCLNSEQSIIITIP